MKKTKNVTAKPQAKVENCHETETMFTQKQINNPKIKIVKYHEMEVLFTKK